MTKKLATWYMESAWLNMGSLRNVRAFHKLFNLAYAARKSEYMAQILAIEPAYITEQKERGAQIRLMLQLNGGLPC